MGRLAPPPGQDASGVILELSFASIDPANETRAGVSTGETRPGVSVGETGTRVCR